MKSDETYMALALEQARLAAQKGDVPVGAVVVRDGEVIATGHNRREAEQSALGHAEIEAIEAACRAVGSWRLDDCTLYVTLEPCPMCAGALVNARMGRVVYGTADAKAGSVGSVINLFALPFNHRPRITTGVLEQPCAQILRDFFKKLREGRE